MRCCSLPIAIIILFYSFFWAREDDRLMRFFFCSSFGALVSFQTLLSKMDSRADEVVAGCGKSHFPIWKVCSFHMERTFDELERMQFLAFTRKFLTRPIPLATTIVQYGRLVWRSLQFQCRIFWLCASVRHVSADGALCVRFFPGALFTAIKNFLYIYII